MVEHRRELILMNENRRAKQCERVFHDRTNSTDYLSDQDLVSKFCLCWNGVFFIFMNQLWAD